ncbi:MAG: sigma-70 family RNA polymerase sigma factor [Isosphaeraceae bacterium]
MTGSPTTEDLGAYRDYLLAVARAQVPWDLRGRVDPSDVVQETLFEAVRDRDGFRGRSGPELMGWLRSLLRFNLIDRLRRQKLENRVVSLDDAIDRTSRGMGRFAIDPGTSAGGRAERAEAALHLATLLGRLPEAQADAIVLKHCLGMSVAEIGRHMNRTPCAVGGLLRHGMRRLREALKE